MKALRMMMRPVRKVSSNCLSNGLSLHCEVLSRYSSFWYCQTVLKDSLGSSGGPDGITPQHTRDLLAGSTDHNLQQALVDFLNLMLIGDFDREISSIIFG